MRTAPFGTTLALIVGLSLSALVWGAPMTADSVLINGRQAVAGRVLVQWKKPTAVVAPSTTKQTGSTTSNTEPQTRASAARLTAFKTVKTFKKLPGLAVLELPAAPGIRSQRNAQAKASTTTLDLKARIAALMATGEFEFVEPDYIVHANLFPNDAGVSDGRLWGLRNAGQSGGVPGADIGAAAAWDITTGSNSVVVAVIDTGIRYTHQDLAANMWRNPGEIAANGIDDDRNGYVDDVFGINSITGSGNPFDDNNHGTHVAGTIGAVANGGGPHVGVAWNVSLMALKFLGADGSGALSDAIECIDYAISKGAVVMNNSWGGGGFSTALSNAIERARLANILFVAAAGNSNSDNDRTPAYPASYPQANIVAVAALDRHDRRAAFSNYGRGSVDLGAPGVSIFSSTAASDSSYDTFDGTSMAAPHVSGVAALLRARFPGISVVTLKQRLLTSVVAVPALAERSVTGGRVSASAALGATVDGVLEISARVPSLPLRASSNTDVFLSVTDLAPVTGATVSARFGGLAAVSLRDNGVAPDSTANDGIYAATLNVGNGGTSVTLTVTASAPGKLDATGTFDFELGNPPPNDNFGARSVIPANTTRTTGSNINAGAEVGEPRNPNVAGGRSVWWSWTAAATGPATITTAGSSFDTTLAVYSGDSLGTLNVLAANDDSGGVHSAVSFSANAGQTYAIQVDGYSNASGAIVLNHPAVGSVTGAPRITDEPDDVAVLVGTPFDLAVTAQGEALSYQWLFNDTPLAAANTATLHVAAASFADGGSYRVRVTNSHGEALSRATSVTVERVSAEPGNNDFAAAIPISGSGRQIGSNQLTDGEPDEPNHAGVSQPLASIWYRYMAAADGTLAANTAGSNFDTVLAAYSGVGLATLIQRAANDDDSGTRQSAISLRVTGGEVYHLAVDGYAGAEGNVTLDYSFIPDSSNLPNDLFAAATTFTGTSMRGLNIGAHGEAGEPNHDSRSTPLASVWWKWTAPANGFVEFDTFGSDYDTTLAVYTGGQLGNLTLRGANDDFNGSTSRLGIAVVAGQTYRVAVDGYTTAEGHIQLSIRASAARPDVSARYSALRGANVYYPTNQEVRSTLRRPTTRGISYFVTNAGTQAGRFRLALSGSLFGKGIVSSLVGPRGDVTAQARAGTLLTAVLAPGESATYTLKIRTRGARTPPNYLYSALLRASNTNGAANPDQVRTLVIVH